MATIPTNTGSTLQSGTAEGRFLELCSFLQILQNDLTKNPNKIFYVSISINASTLISNITFSIPTSISSDSIGNILLVAQPFPISCEFNHGTEDYFKSLNPLQYLMEIIIYLQKLESNPTKNPDNLNYISADFSTDEGIYSGYCSLPLTMSIDNNFQPTFAAKPYLL